MKGTFGIGLRCGLSCLSGFVDAVGYLSLHGLFVAFMSGNSTQLAVAAAGLERRIVLPAALVLAFVLGVMLGTAAGRWERMQRPPAVLVLVAMLLAVAAWLPTVTGPVEAALAMAVAMGSANTVFAGREKLGIGLTYMTGTLVLVGHNLVEALFGGDWRQVWPDLLLWMTMVVGAFAGAFGFARIGMDGLWLAVAAALAMAAAAEIGKEALA